MSNKRLLEAERCRVAAKDERRTLLSAASPSKRNALTVNQDRAHAVWMAAINDGLAKNSAQVEAAYKSAKTANDQVKTAAENSAAVPQRLKAMSEAIEAVKALVKTSKEES